MKSNDLWQTLEQQIQENGIKIDRPKGKAHPRFPQLIYPIDYGYIPHTKSADGEGIDVFLGTSEMKQIVGLICTFDAIKKDSEIKILYACLETEIQMAMAMLSHSLMYALLVRR
jgi:inorganic pyrophosphatase